MDCPVSEGVILNWEHVITGPFKPIYQLFFQKEARHV